MTNELSDGQGLGLELGVLKLRAQSCAEREMVIINLHKWSRKIPQSWNFAVQAS